MSTKPLDNVPDKELSTISPDNVTDGEKSTKHRVVADDVPDEEMPALHCLLSRRLNHSETIVFEPEVVPDEEIPTRDRTDMEMETESPTDVVDLQYLLSAVRTVERRLNHSETIRFEQETRLEEAERRLSDYETRLSACETKNVPEDIAEITSTAESIEQGSDQFFFHPEGRAHLSGLSHGQEVGNRSVLRKTVAFRSGKSLQASPQEFIYSKRRTCTEKQYQRMIDNGSAPTYPEDCYSLLAVCNLKENPSCFVYGLVVFFTQVAFLGLLLNQITWHDENPSGAIFPGNVSYPVQITQFVAVLSFLVFADDPLKDCVKAVEIFPSFKRAHSIKNALQVAFACTLRFIQGFMAMLVSLHLILMSDDVVEIILNFTAVNFVSTLDDCGFELAVWGKWGQSLQKQAKQIVNTPLPYCTYHKRKSIRHLYTVFLTGIVMLSILLYVVVMQEYGNQWTTHTLRVQFEDSNGLEHYNGCYNVDHNTVNNKRHNYNSFPNNTEEAKFGYCKKERRWVLFKDEGFDVDPCNAGEQLAHSGKTDDYDIKGSFDNIWWSSHGSPLSLYFFQSDGLGHELEENCGSFLNDGKCDDFFNVPDLNFDEGDCCASTCSQPWCGWRGAEGAFGSNGTDGIGFPYCKNPTMVPVTIFLNKFSNSRHHTLLNVTEDQVKAYKLRRGEDFWEETPQKPLLDVYCDRIKILSIYIDTNMENKSETIFVNDGADCKVIISNMADSHVFWGAEPIWWVDFTIYHGYGMTNEITSGYSGMEKETYFKLIPEFILDKLNGIIDISTAYRANTASTLALAWLHQNSKDDHPFLIERFALAALNFAAPIIPLEQLSSNSTSIDTSLSDFGAMEETLWIKSDPQCQWFQDGAAVVCNHGSVEYLAIEHNNLNGTIPTLIGLLSGLKRLEYDGNGLDGTIPSELGLLTALTDLDLDLNDLTGTIPTELGLLTNVRTLELDDNKLNGTIPTELGNMVAPTRIEFSNNKLTGTIPIELGYLTNLFALELDYNKLTGSIPSEIGLMTSLVILDIRGNSFTGTIPSEIGNLNKLEIFYSEGNQFTGTIPSQITSLAGLHTTTIPSSSPSAATAAVSSGTDRVNCSLLHEIC